jgi:glucan phosphoethanolaminetransferase (alkaline phosphatase superfamily)
MMNRKEIIKNLLLISCVIILFFLCAFVISLINPGLLETSDIFLRSAFFVIVTSMVVKLIYQIYGKPLTQEMKEEEIKEAEQKDGKQMVLKPTIGVLIFFLFLISMSVFAIFIQFTNFSLIIVIVGFMGFILWMWYAIPTFTFTENSVQIKSYLFYTFRINRKTVFRYADITSVSPDAEFESDQSNMYGFDRRYRIAISLNGTIRKYGLTAYNSDTIAKIYLRFREKLGDKVTIP